MSRVERLAAWLLVSLGIEAVVFFLMWWREPGRVAAPVLFVLFSLVAWFSIYRMATSWTTLLFMTRPRRRPARPGLTVDVITTAAPGEPLEMFLETLEAMTRVRYPHQTYLLDDSHRDELRWLCEVYGVRYLRRERPGEGGKAGNVNHGLAFATGEIVAIFDPDHVPRPEFLDRVLGYFDDPAIGFVQAAQAYQNQRESIVARGAAEQTYELYGPTLMGLQGMATPLLFGCHTTFLRAALDSIGGYAVHNAEDLRTCMRLLAQGWKGVYVPEILARGLVPSDLRTYLRQQYRWAHSVFDLLFRDYWRLLPRWSWLQRIAFLGVCTFYFVGPVILISLVLPPAYLATGTGAVSSNASSFVVHLAPLLLVNLAIRRFAQRFFLSPEERGWHVAGTIMLFASAFAHAAGLIAAIRNVRVPYLVTAKARAASSSLRHVWPHAAFAVVSAFMVVYSFWMGQPEDAWLMRACAAWNALMMGAVVWIGIGEAGGYDREQDAHAGPGTPVRGLAGGPVGGHSPRR